MSDDTPSAPLNVVPLPAVLSKRLVEHIEGLLEDARAGRIEGLLYAAPVVGGEYVIGRVGEIGHTEALGLASRLLYRTHRVLDEIEEGEGYGER